MGVDTERTIRPDLITAQHQGNQVLLWSNPAKTLRTTKEHKHGALDLANLERFQMAIIFFKMGKKNPAKYGIT